MDIVSSDDAYTVTIELPGLKKDDVEISVHERVLTVSGEFKPDTAAPAPSPDLEGYPIGDTEDEEDPFIEIDDNCEKKKKKKDGVILKERRVGKFKRSIDLPSWVDAEKGIKASMADGVLTIVFTKGPESKAKKVNIL
jgi:HSP20 family protein